MKKHFIKNFSVKLTYLYKLLFATLFLGYSSLSFSTEKEITFGFDGLAEWAIDVGDFGVQFTGGAVLTCGSSLNCGPFPPFSGKNVIFDHFDSGGIIKAEFDTQVTGSVFKVSARVTGNTNITLRAFDINGDLLEFDSTGGPNYVGSDSGIPPNKLLEIDTIDIPIHFVTFSDHGNTFTVDNFTFTSSPKKVVIDPGHGKIGGKYQRAPSANHGIIEDIIVLDISKSLGSFFETNNVTYILTRETESAPFAPPDCKVPCGIDLRKRVEFAEKQEPDLLVSIHTNGAAAATAHGTETFYNPATSNGKNSKKLAENINDKLVNLGLRNRGVKEANFSLISSSILTSALTEVAFHSNTELASTQTITDEDLLNDSLFRNKSAKAIGEGIINFFEELENKQ